MSAAMPSTLAWRMRTMRSWLVGSYEMFPVPSCFSNPPMRCSSPAVPGTAQDARHGLRVSQVRPELVLAVAVDVVRLRGETWGKVRQGRRSRGVPKAPTRSRGSRRTARAPACGT